MLALIACAWILSGAPLERPDDEVALKSGKTVAGHVVYCDEERLVLLVGSRERELKRSEIERISAVTLNLHTALGQLDNIAESDSQALLELASYCRDNRLPGEAHVLAWAALAVDPTLEQAHDILGHRKRNKRQYVKVGRDEFPMDDIAKRTVDFGDAWQFETTHYKVYTNLGLADAVGIALDLERIYRDVMDFLAAEIDLYDVMLPMTASVHADLASFPEMLGGRRSYFNPVTRTLFVNASTGYEHWTLAHEAVHQILQATGEGSRQVRGLALPGWLDEGLAEYIAAGAQGSRGRIHARPGGISTARFRTHLESDDLYDFTRVLSFGSDDFLSSSKRELKYAQSYTLVHFLLHAENQRFRPAFMAYLRSCWQGKDSSTVLKRALDLNPREVDERWLSYVRENCE